MIIETSEYIANAFTILHVSESIPNGAFYALIDGKKHEVYPVYESDMRTIAIKGRHNISGKEITFVGK